MNNKHGCHIPAPLQPGDLLWAVAPSGCLREQLAFQRGVEIWRSRGYQVELSPGIKHQWGYLAGEDCDRRQQLLTALKDPDCRGILCARGGYGAMRLLEEWVWPWDYSNNEQSAISNQQSDSSPQIAPKWLIGFSDITALLWSLSRQGIAGVHGPLLTTLSDEPDWSTQRLFDWVAGLPLPPLQGIGWGGGQVTGQLLPANLTVATHLLNTPLQPELAGSILALEDVGEAPYRIDRMLTQWRLCGAFQAINGIALGRFSQCQTPAAISSLTVEEVLRDRLSDLNIPIVSDLPFGHDGPNAALPVGIPVQLDADSGLLSW